jgi:hypothetical protein
MQTDTFGRINGDIYNPSLKWLLTVKCDCDVEALTSEVRSLNKDAEIYLECLVNLAKTTRKYEGKIPRLPAAPEIHEDSDEKRNKSLLGRIWSRGR